MRLLLPSTYTWFTQTDLGNSPLVPWNIGRSNFDGREFSVGEELSQRGLKAKYPVILIPGIISTALENWSTAGQYKAQFRKRYVSSRRWQ